MSQLASSLALLLVHSASLTFGEAVIVSSTSPSSTSEFYSSLLISTTHTCAVDAQFSPPVTKT